jgi:hypothetical protein
VLLSSGADVNSKKEDGRTALHEAASQGHQGIVELLLASGAGVNNRAENGLTALHDAASQGHQGVVALLLSAAADVHSRTVGGITALHIAADKGHQGIVGQLLRAGASADVVVAGSKSPLLLAVKSDHAGVVQQLLDAAVEQQFDVGLGPSAAMSARIDMMQAIQRVEVGIVFGPEVSKLPAVKAALKEHKCSCCNSRLRGSAKKYYKCSRCKLVYYCGPECQKKHWCNGHKEVCKAVEMPSLS